MSHIPVNHPSRPLFRVLATLVGLFVLAFGVIGFFRAPAGALFDQHHLTWVLGLRTNRGFALASVGAGAVILAATFIGRNVDRFVYLFGGLGFMIAGMAMLSLLQTTLNVLGFSMVNVVVSFLIGLVLFAAGLYGKVGSAAQAAAQEAHRHG